MNPYNNSKPRRGQKVVNAILITLAAVAAAGVVTLAVTQRKQIAENVNGMLGDNEKVTFTQIFKKESYAFSGDGLSFNGVLKDGIYTIDNSAGTGAKPFYQGSYHGQSACFESASHDMNGYAIWYGRVLAKSDKVVGSDAGLLLGSLSIDVVTSELNLWKASSGAYVNTSGYCGYEFSRKCQVVAGDVLHFTDYQIVNISSLGVWDVGEACAVFEKLTKGEYFEGDKTFTKGEIKKAVADYEADQKALASSTAASSSKAA